MTPSKRDESPHERSADQALLDLIPMGPVDPTAVTIVAANLQAVMGLAARVVPERLKPDEAFIPSRRQLDATRIIKMVAAETGGAHFKLALTQADLCIPILTYVYGESQLGGRAAVVSLYRLTSESRRKSFDRAAKISLHEVGHLFGLEHCWQAACLMRFSKHLQQLDHLGMHFCPACEYELARRLKRLLRNGF